MRRLVEWFDAKFAREVGELILFEKIFKRLMGYGEPSSESIRAGKKNILYHLDYIAHLLHGRNWLAGEYLTLADISAAAQLSALDYLGDVPWEQYPSVKEWYALIKCRLPSANCSTTGSRASAHPPITPIRIFNMAIQTHLRRLLGDHRYRVVTQFLRTLRIILYPKFEEETTVLDRWVGPGAVCFDIGGNYGQYTRVLSRLTGRRGHVYAFEPSRVTADCLRLTARLMCLPSVTVIQCALGEAAGAADAQHPDQGQRRARHLPRPFRRDESRDCLSETVEVRTLDEFVATNNIARCDFIKCDVEGGRVPRPAGRARDAGAFPPGPAARSQQPHAGAQRPWRDPDRGCAAPARLPFLHPRRGCAGAA